MIRTKLRIPDDLHLLFVVRVRQHAEGCGTARPIAIRDLPNVRRDGEVVRLASGRDAHSLLLCFCAIAAGSVTTIGAMLASGSLQPDLAMLVPVGSMVIANMMNASGQAAERLRADVGAHVGEIEAGLALGADPKTAVAPYVESAVYASLLPRLDMLKSLGLVWIPGVMAGMMVSGASPVEAGIYQFVVVAMILVASGIAGLIVTLLMRRLSFSPADHLRLPTVLQLLS